MSEQETCTHKARITIEINDSNLTAQIIGKTSAKRIAHAFGSVLSHVVSTPKANIEMFLLHLIFAEAFIKGIEERKEARP